MTQLIIPNQLGMGMPTGGSSLPLFPLQLQLAANLPIKVTHYSPGIQSGLVNFTAWELFHAAKKTELIRTFSRARARDLGLCFAHEHHDHFVWNTGNFRCTDGSGNWLEDFSGTALTGRIGEALAYLTMIQLGYVFWDRIASIWLRAARAAKIQHQEMTKVVQYIGQDHKNSPKPQPDFVFEKPNSEIALMEAKGSFVTPGNCNPNIKRRIERGLNQLNKWGQLIKPLPQDSCLIYSLIREQSDQCGDPSQMLTAKLPPSQGINTGSINPIPIPPGLVRRGNLGAWLAGMGFRESGRALADCRLINRPEVGLNLIKLGNRDYAFSVMGWCRDQHLINASPGYPPEILLLHPWNDIRMLNDIGITGAYVIGLDATVLKAVCNALTDAETTALMELNLERPETPVEGFNGSIMPDGSMIGVINTQLLETGLRVKAFTL